MPIEDLDLASDPEAEYEAIEYDAPARTLETIDSQSELLAQYRRARRLQDSVIEDDAIAPEKRAATIRTTTAVLDSIVKMQTALYDSERLKRLESALQRTLKTLPRETQDLFLAIYAEELRREG